MLRSTLRRAAALALAAAATSLAACGGSSDSTRPKSIALSLSTSTAAVTQGQSYAMLLMVSRTNFSGDVSLSASGLPNGVTVSFTPATLSGSSGGSSTLLIAAASGATIGSSTVTITAQGSGVDSQTGSLALTVNAAGSFTIALASTTLSVQQGATGTATITVTRAGGMSGDVALAATGLPAGVTAAFNPATVGASASTSTLTLTASSSATAGTSNVTIKGTSAGLPDQTATLALTIAPIPSGTSISLSFCGNDPPAWVAYQNEGGAWTQATLANNTLAFTATGSKVGVAVVYADATSSDVEVAYATTTELAAINAVACTVGQGTKTINGSVSGLGAEQLASIALGNASASAYANGAFQLTKVANGAFDLVAMRSTLDPIAGTSTPDKVIVHRGLDIADGGTIPELPFASSDAVALIPATLTVGNLGSDQALGGATLYTASGTAADLGGGTIANGTLPIFGLPAGTQVASDLYAFSALAMNTNAARMASAYSKTFGNTTVTLGPAISAPTMTVAATSPYVRVRIQVAKQAEYGDYFSAGIVQTSVNKTFSVATTSGYFGTASTWDVTLPDLSAAAGWNNAWAPAAGVASDWSAEVAGASYNPYLEMPTDGATEFFAVQSSTSSFTPNRLPRAGILGAGASFSRVLPGVRGVAPRLLLDRRAVRSR